MTRCLKKFFWTCGEYSLASKASLSLLASVIPVGVVIVLVPFVRPTCGFLFFTTIPELMVIYALRATKTGPLKTVL
jgi:hypothetical protein